MLSTSPPSPSPRLAGLTPARLSPGYFALVMATGILSVGCQLRGWSPVARFLPLLYRSAAARRVAGMAADQLGQFQAL